MGEIGDAKRARTEFLERYYSVRDRVPPRVTLDGEVEDSELLQEWLSDKYHNSQDRGTSAVGRNVP